MLHRAGTTEPQPRVEMRLPLARLWGDQPWSRPGLIQDLSSSPSPGLLDR